MSRWYERANEASFKPMQGGYVFQKPNPWVLARPSYYLVDDAKKAEILVHLGRWRLMLLLFSVAMPLSIMLIPTIWPNTVGKFLVPAFLALGPGLISLVIFAAAILSIVPFIAVPQIYLARSLRPLLADVPRTAARIKIAEQLPTIAASASSTLLVVALAGALGMIVGGGGSLVDAYFEGHLARSAFASSALIVVGGLMASYLIYLLRLKTKMRRALREI